MEGEITVQMVCDFMGALKSQGIPFLGADAPSQQPEVWAKFMRGMTKADLVWLYKETQERKVLLQLEQCISSIKRRHMPDSWKDYRGKRHEPADETGLA